MTQTASASPTELTTEQVVELTRQLNYGTWRFQTGWNPMHLADAEGCYFTDGKGKRYLDLSAQLMCVNLGHKNPAVIAAIAEQAQALAFASPAYATEARAELSRTLLEVLPQGLTKFFFTTSGTEANEAAFKIARMVTGKTKILARYGRITDRRLVRLGRRAGCGAGRWNRWAAKGRDLSSRRK